MIWPWITSPSVLVVRVITSYSIHYTKLYELAGSGYNNPPVYHSKDGGRSFTSLDEGLPSTLVFSLASNMEETFRITSYNVCYTKLLRNVRLNHRQLKLFVKKW